MKARRVFVTLEVDTNIPLREITGRGSFGYAIAGRIRDDLSGSGREWLVHQVQANVARSLPSRKKAFEFFSQDPLLQARPKRSRSSRRKRRA